MSNEINEIQEYEKNIHIESIRPFSEYKTYEEYVIAGKRLLKSVGVHQAIIGYYATKICTIRHGGRSDGIYTISDYARDIGMNRKTLSEWVAIYKRVVEKLGLNPMTITEKEYRTARKIAYYCEDEVSRRNKEDKKPKSKRYKDHSPTKAELQKIFKETLDEGPSFNLESRDWCNRLRYTHSQLTKRDLSLADEKVLLEMMNIADNISDLLNDYLTSKKKKSTKH